MADSSDAGQVNAPRGIAVVIAWQRRIDRRMAISTCRDVAGWGPHGAKRAQIGPRPAPPRRSMGGWPEAIGLPFLVAGVPLLLSVLKVNPARGLYERLGFWMVGQTAYAYQLRFGP